MPPSVATAEALRFFQALADASRLRLLGLLSLHPHSVEELGAVLRRRPSTISHHLGRLMAAGLVEARAEGYYSVYALAPGAIDLRARRWLSRRALRAHAAGLDLQAFDRRVLKEFTRRDGRLRALPAQRRKRRVILRHLARAFHRDHTYKESDVHRLLRRFYADTVMLQRELLGAGWLRLENGVYARSEID